MTTDQRPTSPQDERDAGGAAGRVGDAPLPIGALLRCAADGELDAAQRATLQSHLAANPADAQRIEFERGLRRACARVMTSESGESEDETVHAPAGLRQRIERSLRQERGTDSARVVVRRIGIPGPGWRRWAGVGTLAAAAALIGIVAFPAVRRAWHPTDQIKSRLVAFLSDEQQWCALDGAQFDQRLPLKDLSEIPATFRSLLGREVSIEDVDAAGLEFVGAGKCGVPGSGRSMHLLFRPRGTPPAGVSPSLVSLFVQTDTGELGLKEGVTYKLHLPQTKSLVVLWLRDGLIYYLVADCPQCSSSVRGVMHAPSATQDW